MYQESHTLVETIMHCLWNSLFINALASLSIFQVRNMMTFEIESEFVTTLDDILSRNCLLFCMVNDIHTNRVSDKPIGSISS